MKARQSDAQDNADDTFLLSEDFPVFLENRLIKSRQRSLRLGFDDFDGMLHRIIGRGDNKLCVTMQAACPVSGVFVLESAHTLTFGAIATDRHILTPSHVIPAVQNPTVHEVLDTRSEARRFGHTNRFSSRPGNCSGH